MMKRKNSIFCILQALKSTGLLTSDPRLRDCMEKIRRAVRDSTGEVMMDRDLFQKRVYCVINQNKFPTKNKCIYIVTKLQMFPTLYRCASGNIVLLSLAFRRKFIIPEFEAFMAVINHIYYTSKQQQDGQVGRVF